MVMDVDARVLGFRFRSRFLAFFRPSSELVNVTTNVSTRIPSLLKIHVSLFSVLYLFRIFISQLAIL